MNEHTPDDGSVPAPASGSDAARPGDAASTFDFDSFPLDTLFHDRRGGRERRGTISGGRAPGAAPKKAPAERREKKERRRRIDPTTFEKQYTDDELEFMNAMQRFKVQSGKAFPTHGEVLTVAYSLGYRKIIHPEPAGSAELVPPSSDSLPEHPAGGLHVPGTVSMP
ncbi:MAG: hypothetical protein U0835_21550 [Isosphaeraceae bacterium]